MRRQELERRADEDYWTAMLNLGIADPRPTRGGNFEIDIAETETDVDVAPRLIDELNRTARNAAAGIVDIERQPVDTRLQEPTIRQRDIRIKRKRRERC